MKYPVVTLCFGIMAAGAFALAAPVSYAGAAESNRYSVVDNGNAIQDSKTGLVWKRCEEGKYFADGVCKGLGIRYNWSDIETMDGKEWRLPTAQELKSLKEDSGVAPPINPEYFPNTDRAWFWSSSADKRDARGCIQNVYFGDNIERRCPTIRSGADQLALKPAYVRLVRAN